MTAGLAAPILKLTPRDGSVPATTFLLLVATVLSVDGDVARIDRGRLAGLRPGDAGTFFYLLTVDSQTRRIEAGTGTLIETGERYSLVEINAGATVRPEHLIEFRIPISPEAGEELLRRSRDPSVPGDSPAPARDPPLESERPAGDDPARSAADDPARSAADDPARVEASVRDFVLAWAAAWSDQRIDAYLACYARNFRPPAGVSRSAWESQRRQRISRPRSIHVSVEELSIITVASRVAVATFVQSYRSDSYRDRVSKLLDLVRQDGEWKILEERVD